MHMFLNIIGCIHNKPRSKNTIALEGASQLAIRNAEIVGFVTHVRAELAPQFTERDKVEEAKNLQKAMKIQLRLDQEVMLVWKIWMF